MVGRYPLPSTETYSLFSCLSLSLMFSQCSLHWDFFNTTCMERFACNNSCLLRETCLLLQGTCVQTLLHYLALILTLWLGWWGNEEMTAMYTEKLEWRELRAQWWVAPTTTTVQILGTSVLYSTVGRSWVVWRWAAPSCKLPGRGICSCQFLHTREPEGFTLPGLTKWEGFVDFPWVWGLCPWNGCVHVIHIDSGLDSSQNCSPLIKYSFKLDYKVVSFHT